MAILYMDGFDKYATIGEFEEYSGYAIRQGGGFTTSGGRYGGGALTHSTENEEFVFGFPKMFVASDDVIISWSFKWTATGSGLPANLLIIYAFDATPDVALVLRLNDADGDVTLADADGDVATTAGVNPLNVTDWHRIEVKLNIGTGANGTCTVDIDEVEVINETGLNFHGTSGGTLSSYHMGGPTTSGDFWIDDLVIQDTTGSAPYNDILGDVRIDSLVPDADGSTVDWTRNTGSNDFEAVDDPLSSTDDGDTTYVAASAAGAETRFSFEPVASAHYGDEVFAVQVCALGRKDAPGTATARMLANNSASEDVGSAVGFSHSDYSYKTEIFIDDPATSAQWANPGAVDDSEFGLEIVTAGA